MSSFLSRFKRNTTSAAKSDPIAEIAESTGRKYEEILADIDHAKDEFGVSKKDYINYEFYDVPESERKEKSVEIRRIRRANKVMANTGWDFEKASAELDRAKEEYGIKNKEYVKHELYNVPESDWTDIISAARDEETIRKIHKETQLDVTEIAHKLSEEKDVYSVTPEEFYKKRLWELTGSEISRKVRGSRQVKDRIDDIYEYLQGVSGKSRKEIRGNIRSLKEMEIYPLVVTEFYRYGFIYRDEEDQVKTLEMLKKLQELRDEIKTELDCGNIQAGKQKYEAGKALIAANLSDEAIKEHGELISEKIPGVDLGAIRDLAVDLESVSMLLRYTYNDFFDFHFAEKPFEERVTYLSGLEKKDALKILNPEEKRGILDDKFLSYQYLKKWYDRDAVIIETADDYESFAAFMREHKAGLKKPFAGMQGKGIEKVTYEDDETLARQFHEMLESDGKFILEELIISHPMMKEIYPHSINTVRINTLVHDGKVTPMMPFFRVGTGGNIVDNGAQGGIMATIDIETGEMISGAVAHNGLRYDRHPDTGTVFKGIKFPKWQELLDLTEELALKVAAEHGLYFVGWDMTYAEGDKWVVVEGNAESSMQLSQIGVETGMKDYFRSIVQPVLDQKLAEQEQ